MNAADLDRGAVWVVAGREVHRVVAAVAPSVDVRRFGSLTALWGAVSAAEFGSAPRLLVLAERVADSPDLLAEAVAYYAPKVPVVLIHQRDGLEDLGERYLRVVDAHPDQCDRDAPVEVVSYPTTGKALATALRAVAPRDLPIGDCPPALAGTIGEDDEDPPPGVDRSPRDGWEASLTDGSRVVALASSKGGAGKTTTAVALAVTLGAAGHRVCLVDLDVDDGQLATIIGCSTPNVATLSAAPGGITDETVLAHLVDDARLGIHVLLAPVHVEDEVRLLNGQIHRAILAVLRRHFDVIVLDCPVTYREPLIAGVAFGEADRILVVTTLAMTSLAGMSTMLRALTGSACDGLDVAADKLGVVVNAALNGVGIDRRHVAAHTLGVPVVAVVPHAARDTLIATNQRRMELLADHPDLGPAYRQLAKWAVGLPARRSRVPRRHGTCAA